MTAAGDKSPIDETTDAKTPEPEKKSEPASDKPKEVAESSEPVEKSDENKPVAKSPNKSDQ